jgi:hypothetical protein
VRGGIGGPPAGQGLRLATLQVLRVSGAVCIALTVGLAGPLRAQADTSSTTAGQFWPELDLYYSLSKVVRLYGIATYTIPTDNGPGSQQYGANLDLFSTAKIMPLRRFVQGPDALAQDRAQPLQLRTGYRYSVDFNTSAPAVENRLILEGTGRLSRRGVTLSDRNGVDFRWTNGAYSSRYRNRLYLEVPVKLKRYDFTPYANVELFYSLSNGTFTKVRYEAGAQLPVLSHITTEVYAGYETYWHTTPSHAAGMGVNLVLSW